MEQQNMQRNPKINMMIAIQILQLDFAQYGR